MNCQSIEKKLNILSVDKAGRIRGKSKCMDAIHTEHLKDIDTKLMEVRVFVARMSTGNSTTDALKMIDEFIYKMQVG